MSISSFKILKNMSNFENKITSGKFCITCELSPPKGPDATDFESKVRRLRGKVDAVNVTDNPRLSVRMSPVIASYLCIKNGAEPVMQMTCRDRNILAITSDLISACFLGIRNVLVLRGDHPKNERPRGVFELSVVDFLKLIHNLNQGVDFRNNWLNSRCDFFAGAALNPFDEAQVLEANLVGKLEAGAKFFQTQPVFDISSVEHFKEIVERRKANVLLGVMIVSSEKTLEALKSFAKGIVIPQKLIEGLSRFEKKEDKEKFGIEFSLELIEDIKSLGTFRGVHIYSPLNEELIIRLMENLPS